MKKVYFLCSNILLPGGTERAITTTIGLLESVENLEAIVVSLSSCNGETPYFPCRANIIHCSLEPFKKTLQQKVKWYWEAVKKLTNVFHDLREDDIILSYGHNVSIMLPFISTKAKRYACEHINYYSISRMARFCMRMCYPCLEGVIVLSSIAKKKMQNLNGKIHIIPNSVPFVVDDDLPQKGKTIIMVGRISPEKGYERVVPIARILKSIIPDWKIEIWGDGADFDRIYNLYRIEGVDDYVFLMGATKDITSVYKRASLLMMTSYTEALPMVIIEANAYGIPVVAYECEGSLELITDGMNGFIVKDNEYVCFADKIIEVLIKQDKYNLFSKSAIEMSSSFSNDVIRSKWIDLIM